MMCNFNIVFMKKSILVLAVAVMATITTISAQPQGQKPQGGERPTKEEMAEKMNEKMVEELGLSKSQATKLAAINATFAEAREGAKGGERGEKRGEGDDVMKAAKQAYLKSMVQLLDDDQIVKFMEMKEQRQRPQMQRGGQRGGGPQMQRGGQPGGRPQMQRGGQPGGRPQMQRGGQRGGRPQMQRGGHPGGRPQMQQGEECDENGKPMPPRGPKKPKEDAQNDKPAEETSSKK